MVTDKQKRNLDYFKNKIVTIFTSPINRQFSEQELLEYFEISSPIIESFILLSEILMSN